MTKLEVLSQYIKDVPHNRDLSQFGTLDFVTTLYNYVSSEEYNEELEEAGYAAYNEELQKAYGIDAINQCINVINQFYDQCKTTLFNCHLLVNQVFPVEIANELNNKIMAIKEIDILNYSNQSILALLERLEDTTGINTNQLVTIYTLKTVMTAGHSAKETIKTINTYNADKNRLFSHSVNPRPLKRSRSAGNDKDQQHKKGKSGNFPNS